MLCLSVCVLEASAGFKDPLPETPGKIKEEADILTSAAQRELRADPTFRGVKESPDVVFESGFRPKSAKRTPLPDHIAAKKTNWLSTSKDAGVSVDFAASWTNKAKEGETAGWVYRIYKKGGVDVNELAGAYGGRSLYAFEQEVSYAGGVGRDYIMEAFPVRGDGKGGYILDVEHGVKNYKYFDPENIGDAKKLLVYIEDLESEVAKGGANVSEAVRALGKARKTAATFSAARLPVAAAGKGTQTGGSLSKGLGKLNLGPMDFVMTGALSPVMFKMGGGDDRAGRLATMNALENFTVEPLAMAAAKKLLLRAGFTGVKLSLGSMLPLAPLVVAESFVEDSIEEYHRTVKLNKLGIEDVEGDAYSVMGRAGEGWSDFAWNSSEERAIKGGEFYARLSEGYFKEMEGKARAKLGRDLDEGDLLLVYEEAEKRAKRVLADKIDDDINRLRRIEDPARLREEALRIAGKFNGDPEFAEYAGAELTAGAVFDMAIEAVQEDAHYAASAPGMMFKGLTDAVYGGVRGFNEGAAPAGAVLAPAGEALQGAMTAAADVLAPVGAALEPGVSAAQKEIEKGLASAGGALEPAGKALWDFGAEVGKHLSPVTDVVGKVAMNVGGLFYNALGFGAAEADIREKYDEQVQALSAAKAATSEPGSKSEPDAPLYASMGPSPWKTAAKKNCGEGYVDLWKGNAKGWECARLPGEGTSGGSAKLPRAERAKNAPAGPTRTLVEDSLGPIQVEQKTLRACKPYYLLLDSGVCIKDTGLFRKRENNPRLPYRGVEKCELGEKVIPSDAPRKGAKLCVKLR